MDFLNWQDEPDLDQLRELHARLAERPQQALPGLAALGERGSLASALYLADFYMGHGRLGPADKTMAIYWYSKAHEKGYAHASYMLGRIYSESGDYASAFLAFSRGAEKGYAPAVYRLAKLYQNGDGVLRDTSQCKRLLEIARSKGHIFAKRDLAALLLSGRFGVLPALRGALMLLSLWFDLLVLIARAIRPGSTIDDRVLA